MRLALVSHHVREGDGQSRVNAELARALLRRGADVTLVAEEVAPELLDLGARWAPVRTRLKALHLLKVPEFARAADRALERLDVDAVVACGVSTFRPHALNAVHFVHGTWLRSPFHASRARPGPYGWYQRAYSEANARWERGVFGRAGTVVAVSDMVRGELLEIGVPADKVEVVVNGVDVEAYAPGPAHRRALGLPEGVPLGLFVGDLVSPMKNADGLIRALASAPGLHLALVGAKERSPYPALARRAGVADRVHFLGFRRDVADLMRAADFFALPSRRDSCPLVLLEAMASGLPILTTRTVGTADLVEDGGAGLIIGRPDDGAGLARALLTLGHDDALRTRMGRSARRVAEAHSWDRMADGYVRLLERSVGTASAARAPAPALTA